MFKSKKVSRYAKIVEAGFLLQLDCPDLAMGRHHAYSKYSMDLNKLHLMLIIPYVDNQKEKQNAMKLR